MKNFGTKTRAWFKDTKDAWITLFITNLAGVIVYWPLITQILPNPDSIWNGLYQKMSDYWEIALSRFGLSWLDSLRNFKLYPTIDTLLAIFLVSLAVLVIGRLLKLSGWKLWLGGLVIMLTPCFMDSLTYYYCSDAYALSFLFASLAAYFWSHSEKKLNYLWGCLFLVGSLSIYQAYFFVTITLLLFNAIKELEENKEIKQLIKKYLLILIMIIVAALVYLGLAKIVQMVAHVKAYTGNGFSSLSELDLNSILKAIPKAYKSFGYYYFSNYYLRNTYYGRWIINTVIFLIGIINLFMIGIKLKKDRAHLFLWLLAIGLIPLAIFGVCVIAFSNTIEVGPTGILMVPGVSLIYLFFLSKVSIKKTKLICVTKIVMIISLAALIVNFSLFANLFQNVQARSKKLYLEEVTLVEKYLSDHYTDLHGRKILIIGTIDTSIGLDKETVKNLSWTVARYGLIWNIQNGQVNGWHNLFADFTNFDYQKCKLDDYVSFVRSDTYKNMTNIFPDEGSVIEWNGMIVVNLGFHFAPGYQNCFNR